MAGYVYFVYSLKELNWYIYKENPASGIYVVECLVT